jgi:hypothetical protein
MAARSRTTLIPDCASRLRDAEAELTDARRELEAAIAACGWREISRYQSEGAAPAVIYQRDTGEVDELTGLPAGDVEVRTLDAFTRGEVE